MLSKKSVTSLAKLSNRVKNEQGDGRVNERTGGNKFR